MSDVLNVPVVYECLSECGRVSEKPGYCDACRERFRAERVLRRTRKRRERIATAVLAGFANREIEPEYAIPAAVRWADALIAELDKA